MRKAIPLLAVVLATVVAGCSTTDSDEPVAAPSVSASAEPSTTGSTGDAYSNLMDSVDDLEAATEHAEDLDVHALMSEPTLVTDEFMSMTASTPYASPELRAYAQRVAAGEGKWSDIEVLANPLPHEVTELKESPNFVWTW